MFSLSVFAFQPLGSLSAIVFVFLCLILFPSLHLHTDLHAALLFVPTSLAFFSASLDRHNSFAFATRMLPVLLASLSYFSIRFVCSSLHSRICLHMELTITICGCSLSLLVSNQSIGAMIVFVAVSLHALFTFLK